MFVRVIKWADSVFKVNLLIPLSHDAMSEADNETVPVTNY